ncbi:MAG: class I SAM-dependent methyltransferase [Chitinophagaceae bacterium]|nr:MAG: class I SAM-dependent methyltransferase [Chitinophagaceae bacterium]
MLMHQPGNSYRDRYYGGMVDNDTMSQLYIAVREREKRLVTDEELLKLPEVDKHHLHYHEWEIRKRSCKHLLAYVAKKNRALRILEIGCGNGWLCNRLSSVPQTEVTGIDINKRELEQACKVFGHRVNLQFIAGDIRHGILGGNWYDLVVFAASIQYFPSLIEIISRAKRLLTPNGEIYITDTMFYSEADVVKAGERSAAYFNKIGFPGMSACYFHHPVTKLEYFNYRFLNRPGGLLQKILKHNDPFYRIVIKSERI